jgi:Fe-S-cluster-containing hydrogenase component 2
MLANYGYEDASGNYYISINTDLCAQCTAKGCLEGCPSRLFEIEADDYDDEVAIVKEEVRNTLKSQCASCKPHGGRPEKLPCQVSCPGDAITHSW